MRAPGACRRAGPQSSWRRWWPAQEGRDMAGGLLKVVSAAALGATVAAVASAQARPPSSHERVLCRPFQHLTTAAGRGPRYVVRNDTFGHRSECLVNVDDLPDFRISKSGAHGTPAEPGAYPNIFLGCSWRVCSPAAPEEDVRIGDRLGRVPV